MGGDRSGDDCADEVLALSADVPDGGFEGYGDGEAGEDERGGVNERSEPLAA